MDSRKFLTPLSLIILGIFLVNFLAMEFYWYSSLWYLDMLMHFLGGVWIGLALVWIFKIKEISLNSAIKIALGVLVIGVFWEVFEIIVNQNTTRNYFNFLDTLSDIFFDLAGGFSILLLIKKIMFNSEIKI